MWDTFATSFRSANDLEELTLEAPSRDIRPKLFRDLLSKGMNRIKKLSIESIITSAHLKAIAANFKQLEHLNISGLRKIDAQVLHSILVKNPNMHSIFLKEHLDEDDDPNRFRMQGHSMEL